MLTITENAREELEAFFTDKPKSTMRIYLAPGCCSGPHLALALDEPGEDDVSLEQGGFNFCINGELWKQIGGVTIDLSHMGFILESTQPLPEMASSCASRKGCGGCGGGCGN